MEKPGCAFLQLWEKPASPPVHFQTLPPQEPVLNVEIHWRVMSQERKESLQQETAIFCIWDCRGCHTIDYTRTSHRPAGLARGWLLVMAFAHHQLSLLEKMLKELNAIITTTQHLPSWWKINKLYEESFLTLVFSTL